MTIHGRRRLQSSRMRARRVDRVFLRIMQCALVILFLFVLTSMLSHHEGFQIRHVSVDGAEATNVVQVKSIVDGFLAQSFLGRILRNNVLFYPRHDIVEAIYALDAHIEHVAVDVNHARELSVVIKEYTPALLWCTHGGGDEATSSESCFLADKHGYIYAHAPAYSGYPFPIFHTDIAGVEEEGSPLGFHVLPEEEFARMLEFREVLDHEGIATHEVAHSREQDYDIVTSDGWHILFSTRRDAKESAENLSVALLEIQSHKKSTGGSTTPTVIDLRFENKVFYQ